MTSDESLPPQQETLKFWTNSSDDGFGGKLHRLFNSNDYGDEMREIDENYEQGSALSIYDGHAYTPAIVKVNDMDIENNRLHFIDALYKAIHKDRTEMDICFEKVTQTTVGWFNKSSFVNKLNFIVSLLDENSSLGFLCILLRAITSHANSKDLIYSTNQGIGAFEFDLVTEGQNLAMDSHTLRQAQTELRTWFASFSDLQKMRFVLSLLVGSGGAILRRVYLEVEAMVRARELRNEQLKAMKDAGTFLKVAVKYGLSPEVAAELPFELLEREHNLIMETEQEEERLREEAEATAKKESKKEKKEKGKGKKGKVNDPPEDKKAPEEEENGEKKEEKRVESLETINDVKKEDHPLDLAAREILAEFEQAVENLRLSLKVDEFGKQYPAPPPPVEEVEKKGKKGKKGKGDKEDKEDKGGKKGKKDKDGKKEKEGKKGKGDKKEKEKKEKPEKKGKKSGKGLAIDPGVDQIQLLPLTLNRRILLSLGEKQLKSLKQISSYWAKMVDDITAEMKARKAIDDAIKKMGASSGSAKASKKSSKKGKKGSGGKKKTGSSKSSAKSTKSAKSKSTKSKSSKASKASKASSAPVEIPSRVPAAQGHEATLAAFGGTADSTSSDVYTNRCLRVNVASRFFGARVTAQSVDGRMFASSNARSELEFYSLRSGALLPFRLSGHDRWITCMKFLEIEGTEYIVTGSKDGSARLWNVPLLTSERIYLGHTDTVTGVDACDELVATTGADKMLRVCDRRSTMLATSVSLEQAPSALCLLADPPLVFLGFPSGDIAVHSIDAKVPVVTMVAHDAEVTCFHLVPPLLASGGADKVARLWSVVDLSASCLSAFKHNSAVCCVRLSRQQLVTATQDATFSVWSVVTGVRLRQVRLPCACRVVGVVVHAEPQYARVLVSADLAVYAYEFHLHGSLRQRTPSRPRKIKSKTAPPKVHFAEGACVSSVCTGLPITSRHPPYHRTSCRDEREKLRRRRGFPESRFYQAIQGVAMRPQGYLNEILNVDQMEANCNHALRLFPMALTTERKIPEVARYPAPDPNAAAEPDAKYKLRKTGRLDTSYQTLLQMYNARYPVLDVQILPCRDFDLK